MWIAFIVILIVAVAVSIAFQPHAAVPKPATLGDFNMPTAEPGRPIPVVFGTVMITGPNIVWYGDLDKEPVYATQGGK